MKNYITSICLFLFFLPQDLLSQDQKGGDFQVYVDYVHVQNKVREGSDSGVGIGVEYHFPVVKSIGLDALAGIGYERLVGCSPCYSEWFQNGYRFGLGLSKRFQIKDTHKFMAQLRYGWVGFERYEVGVMDPDGTIVEWYKADNPQDLIGLRFGYFLPVKVPLVLSYTYEYGSFHTLNSLALGFKF